MNHAGAPATRGLRWAMLGLALLSITWGTRLGVRPVLAFGLANLAVIALLWLYPRIALRRLELARTMTGTACEEDEVLVSFELRNRSRLPLFVPEVEDMFTPDKVPRRWAFVYPLLPGRSGAEARYLGSCYSRRGKYAIGPAMLRVSCPTGLFSCERPEASARALTVYPDLEELPELPVDAAGRAPSFGGRARREAGEGDVTLAVREYRPGDALRRIHWPTTARRARLTILEYERQLARRVTIVLDLSRSSLRGLGRQATSEVAIRLAASAASHYLGRGGRLALEARGHVPLSIPPGRGRAQLYRILGELALVRPTGEVPLSALLEELAAGIVSGQGVFLVVSDVEDDGPNLLDSVSALRRRGCGVVVALLDPGTFPRIWDRGDVAPPRLEELAEAFVARGATVYVIKAGTPLAECMLAPYAGRQRIRLTREMLA